MSVVDVSKLGYVAFRSEDVERLADYYTSVLELVTVERVDGAVYLTTGADHHCVVIEPGPRAARSRVGMQVRGDLSQARARLEAHGIACEHRSDPEPGIAAAVVIEEPGGTPLHLYERQDDSGVRSALGIRPVKLGHVASFVPAIDGIRRFYEDVLGFRWSDTVGDFFVFLRCGPDHHAANFFADPVQHGLHHVAFETRDVSHFKEVIDQLSIHGYPLEWGPGRHGAGHNLFGYHRDPDGNLVEIFTEIDVIFDEQTGWFEPRPWHETFPQGPRVWPADIGAANRWGIPKTSPARPQS